MTGCGVPGQVPGKGEGSGSGRDRHGHNSPGGASRGSAPILLSQNAVPASHVGPFLDARHYLGAIDRGLAWSDEFGVIVLTNPTSRRLPPSWREIARWCLLGEKNAGSRQWARVRAWLLDAMPDVTTLVSYSDPDKGHTGALYRACGWLWAPTWHRLRTPPSGNGDWGTGRQGVKDRWVYPLRRDPARAGLLRVNDESIMRAMPWAEYREPTWRYSRFTAGGGDFKRWLTTPTARPDARGRGEG